jgi:hypothetical protein
MDATMTWKGERINAEFTEKRWRARRRQKMDYCRDAESAEKSDDAIRV